MSAIHRVSFAVVLCLVVSMTSIGLAVGAPAVQPSRTPFGQDRHDPIVILRVRALVPEKVKLSDPSQGTVLATVLAIDEAMNQITVQTDEGQRLMLFLDPASFARLHVGAPCLLQVTNWSTPDSPQPPEREEAFW